RVADRGRRRVGHHRRARDAHDHAQLRRLHEAGPHPRPSIEDAVRIVMIGPPGAGKGTQARSLSDRYDVPQISTGEMRGEAQREGTTLGREAQRYMDEGRLVPDDVVIGIVEQRLEADDARRGFILDGFPRTVAQAEALDVMLARHATPVDAVIAVDVPRS